MSSSLVPFIPENAPFTPEQRAYLNGLFAGLFSQGPAAAPAPAAKALTPLSILFASQSGNAENLAKRASKEAAKRGFAPTVHDVAQYTTAQLASEHHVLVIASTFGDGDPPDTAQSFWNFLTSDAAPKLAQMRFSVCALGDSSYPKFCAFGKNVDARLQALGGESVHPRADCDVDFEQAFAQWLDCALQQFGTNGYAQQEPLPTNRLTLRPMGTPAAPPAH
jgi:sulfite reductase (NADPH) flavoprotein alpha-component